MWHMEGMLWLEKVPVRHLLRWSNIQEEASRVEVQGGEHGIGMGGGAAMNDSESETTLVEDGSAPSPWTSILEVSRLLLFGETPIR
jgi:hypothetical protein